MFYQAFIWEPKEGDANVRLKRNRKGGEELRQRLLFIVLLVVVVLVGYTIFRPKPKAHAKISTAQKTAVTQKQTPTQPMPPTPAITKQEVKIETSGQSQKLMASDTITPKKVAVAEKPKEPTSVKSQPSPTKPAVSEKLDTTRIGQTKLEIKETQIGTPELGVTKPAVSQKPVTQTVPEEKTEKWGTDPFIRDWVLATEIKDLRLKAVTISGTKAYALINDQILEKGEIIMGKRIVQIERDKVILEQGGRQFTLFLGE